jgi:hypothetical protein
MDEKIIHVVTAHRKTNSQHSYVVGLYEKEKDALQAAKIESLNRGRKYAMRTNPYHLNRLPEDLTNTEHD